MASSGDRDRAAVAEAPSQGLRAAVAAPGEGVRAVAAPGHGVRVVVPVPPGEGVCAPAAPSEGKRDLLDSLDYPCTARFRFRRLLSYLREYRCDRIYDVAKNQLGVIFHVEDLVEQVKTGQLQEAYDYVRTFATMMESSNEAELLAQFLEHLAAIVSFAHGHTRSGGLFCDWFERMYGHPALNKYPCFATLVADALFLRPFRNSMDWQLVRNKAAEIVEELAYKAPDLKERTRYPRCPNDLYDVMPIRSSLRRRRQVKNTCHKQPADLARFYLQLRKRVPSSSQTKCHSGSAWDQGEILIALLDKSLQAGKLVLLNQDIPREYLSNGVFPLVDALAFKSAYEWLREQGLLVPGYCPSRKHTSNQGTKHLRFEDTAHPGNDLKRPRTAGNFAQELSDETLMCGSQVFPLVSVLAYKSVPDLLREAMKRRRFQESVPAHPGNDLKRPRTTGGFGDPGKPSSTPAASDGVPLPLDSMAGLSEEVAQTEQEPEMNVHGQGKELNLDSVNLEGIDLMYVLDSRRRMATMLDALVRGLPVLQFVVPARKSLQIMLECCNGSITVALLTKMVRAPAILQALVTMRDAQPAALDSQRLEANPEALNLFISINQEVDALELKCLQAMKPPLPGVALPPQVAPPLQEIVALPAPAHQVAKKP